MPWVRGFGKNPLPDGAKIIIKKIGPGSCWRDESAFINREAEVLRGSLHFPEKFRLSNDEIAVCCPDETFSIFEYEYERSDDPDGNY